MTDMFRRRHPIHDEERARRTPPTWRIWQVARANFVALVLVVLAYGLVGYLVLYNGWHDDQRDTRQAADRRAGICLAVVEVGPLELARAFQQDLTDPTIAEALVVYRRHLYDALGFCPGPRP